ncbi:MAG: glutathione S-transferase family protein [Pseudomonadota bacterium]
MTEPPLKPYDHPLSPYAQKVKIALNEKGLEYETELPAALGSGTTAGDFAAGSPRGEVPLLVHGSVSVFDSTIILEYIEDQWPEPALLPGTPVERARVRMLEDAMDTHYEAINWGLSEIVHFRRAEGAAADALLEQARGQLDGWFRWLTAELGDRTWFNGDRFGWGDLAVLPYLNGSAGFDCRPTQPALVDWMARANDRDSVRPVVAAAQAVGMDSDAVSLEAVHAALEQGLFKREYRDHRLEWMIKTGGLEIVRAGLERGNIRFIDPFPTG